MLDRQVIKEFLEEELEDIEIPKDISFDELVETFCKFTEDDYYEWLKDNFESFFASTYEEGIDWKWVREKIKEYKKEDC